MKGTARCLMALVLVVGLVPLPAFAQEDDSTHAVPLQAAPLESARGTLEVASGVTAVLEDANLYAALCEQLDAKGVAFTRDDDARKIALSESACAEFTSLDVSGRAITSLNGLGAFTNLRELDFSNNQVSDLSSIDALVNLSTLKARGNALANVCLDAVAKHTALTTLDLSLNQLVDSTGPEAKSSCITSKLSALKNLKRLELSANQVRYVAGLEEMRDLTFLNLYDNYVRDFEGLAGHEKLEHLDLGENNETGQGGSFDRPISDENLGELDDLKALTYLDFSENYTPAIVEHVKNMKGLTFLQLQKNKVADLGGVAGLSALTTLILSDNEITSIQPLLQLGNLEELNLNRNALAYTAEGSAETNALHGTIVDGKPVWPKLRKLDVNRNFNQGGYQRPPEMKAFLDLSTSGKEGALELNYHYLTVPGFNTEGLLHEDDDGTRYTTYDDFGARCDGVYDDFIAILNAHAFSERNYNCEVRAGAGKTYHIFAPYNTASAVVVGDVDWQGATFKVHDETIENKLSRYSSLFYVQESTRSDYRTLEDPVWDAGSVGVETKALPQLADTLADINEKSYTPGYERYFVTVTDAGTQQFKRSSDGGRGQAMRDSFIIDGDCTVLNGIQWDFANVTSVRVMPIPNRRHFMRDATFSIVPTASGSEAAFSRSGKNDYWRRDVALTRCFNMDVSGIEHRIESTGLAGSYLDLLMFESCGDIALSDCTLFGQRFNVPGRSSYSLGLNDVVGMTLRDVCEANDITDMSRWADVGGDYLKDIVVEGCTMTDFDAHCGVCNLSVRGSAIGGRGIAVVGQGTLDVRDTLIASDRPIQLRGDYGSTWNGRVNLVGCTWRPLGSYRGRLIAIDFWFGPGSHDGEWWDFGYECRFPNVYVEDLTIDDSLNASYPEHDLIANGLWAFYSLEANVDKVPKEYWPTDIVVNGYRFAGGEKLSATPRFNVSTTDAGTIRDAQGNYFVGDVEVALSPSDAYLLEDAEGRSLEWRMLEGEEVRASGPVTVSIAENATAANAVRIVRDGEEVEVVPVVRGTWSRKFEDAGAYRVELSSTSAVHGWEGSRVLKFTVPSAPSASLKAAIQEALGKDLASIDVSEVKTLDLSNKYLKNVEGLESLTALESLNISNNNIADISPLASLTNLTELKAYGNRIEDIVPICGLSKLTHLELAKNELIDNANGKENCYTSQLSALKNLEYLDLSHNLIRYTDGLGSLPGLAHLDLYDNAVHDFSGLADASEYASATPRFSTSLKHLDLGENNEQTKVTMTGLDTLGALTNLEYLDFSENQTPEIMAKIVGLGKLTFLQLQMNEISDVSKLAKLGELKTLILANNNVETATPLFSLKALEELNLQDNATLGKSGNAFEGVFSDKSNLGSIVWPNLRVLNIMNDWQWSMRTSEETRLLYHWGKTDGHQFDFRYDRIYFKDSSDPYDSTYGAYPYAAGADGITGAIEKLVKADADDPNLRYVTYDDFGARHDGSSDDYSSMVNAHLFANAYQAAHPELVMEVRATPDASYHIFNNYNLSWYEIKTNVDWQGATIVIHDEDIENKPGRWKPLFIVRSLDGGAATSKRTIMSDTFKSSVYTVVSAPSCTVGTSLKAGSKLPQEIVDKFPEGYERYVVEFMNEDKKHHIRSGETNANDGEAQYDGVIAKADGTLENDVQWDFDKLTRVQILPIPARQGSIRNANFVHTGLRSRSEVPYYRGGGKGIYFMRNIQTQYTANIDISNITHRLGNPDDWSQDWDEVSGSYFGLLSLQYIADVTVHDSSFYGRKYCDNGRSTYDLPYTWVINCTFRNINDKTGYSKDHRWSVISGHGGKNVTFDSCTTNSAGTHQTVYNMTLRNCNLSTITLCGQGLFLAEGTTVHSTYFASLRVDYGVTWNGDMRIVDCTHVYDGRNRPHLIDTVFDTVEKDGRKSLCEYGYPVRFPKLYVENLKVDYTANARETGSWNEKNGTYYVMFNSTELYDPEKEEGALDYVPAEYWNDNVVVNGVNFENADVQVDRGSAPSVQLTATKKGHIADRERNFLMANVHLSAGDSDFTQRLFAGETVSAKGPVKISALPVSGARGSLELVKLGGSGGKDAVLVSRSSDQAPWESALSDPGDYELRVSSTSFTHGWTGSRTLKFTVKTDSSRADEDAREGEGKETPTVPIDSGGEGITDPEQGQQDTTPEKQPASESELAKDSSDGKTEPSHADDDAREREGEETPTVPADSGGEGIVTPEQGQQDATPEKQPASESELANGLSDGKAETGSVKGKMGKMAVLVKATARGTCALVSASSAKGTVKVDKVKTADGRTLRVAFIAVGAFKGSKAAKVTIGSSVKVIGKDAFRNCKKLKSVDIGKNVKSIGKNAFSGCKKLTTVKLRSSKLAKTSFRNIFKGSKVRTVKLVGMSKAQKKKALAKYAKWLNRGARARIL